MFFARAGLTGLSAVLASALCFSSTAAGIASSPGAAVVPDASPKRNAPPPRGAPADPKAAIAERHRKRDETFKKMEISPFTSLGVFPIEAHRPTRAGGDATGVEIDPNTTRPNKVGIMVGGTGVYVTAVSGGEAVRLRKTAPGGDPAPGEGVILTGLRRLGGDELVGLGRFLLQISGGAGGGRISVHDPEAPAKKRFSGFKWFDPDPALQIRALLKPIPNPDRIKVATSDGQQRDYYRFGTFEFTIDGKTQKLTALAPGPKIGLGATLFIPFRDATNGRETYANGRYLELRYEGPGASHLLDFNRTINPYCDYSPWYSCPIPPKENTLSVPIRAGEMSYPHSP